MAVIDRTDLPLSLLHRGKVRDVYEVDPSTLLLVASDRISAYDCVLPQPIPRKGAVLTQISAFWFARTSDIVRNHCLSADPDEIVRLRPGLAECRDGWAGRGMLVERAEPFPVECVVRGYLAGSGWREYRDHGTLIGERLPDGLLEGGELDEPRFTPATKAEEGHDENITFEDMREILGLNTATILKEFSLSVYRRGRDEARERGIILADTKFEFGTSLGSGEILLIDEALTPDSSRFWPADTWEPGRTQPSLDKQPVRDFLDGLVEAGEWDRQPPAPDLTGEVVRATTDRYLQAYRRLTGEELPDRDTNP
ncbi:MAG TPA: phosphoribosylaminoimidazolesuccinocarboxamide synthase [Gemmatimonadota bacterium]|nr:phosphoribosylaminoimidazolesuccinocarboxamide synthase [Gemmatimonadota bacterium]